MTIPALKKPDAALWAAVVFAFVLAGQTTLRAQVPAAETLRQQTALRAAEPATAAAASTDADLGDIEPVQRYPKPDMFTFLTTQSFFYTSNVFYTHHNPQASSAYLGSYTGSFVPYSTRDWTPRISAQWNMVRYGTLSAANFDNENAAFSSAYVFGGDRSWNWTADINLSRFTQASADSEHEFYKEVVYDNQVSHTTQVLKDVPLFFIAGYDLAYHEANPADFDRLDNVLSFSMAYYPIPEVSIGPFVRPGSRIYFTDTETKTFRGRAIFKNVPPFIGFPKIIDHGQHDRDDFNIAAGIDVTWTPIKYLSLSADFDYASDYSNNSQFSYDQSSPGISLTGTYKF